ncbi:carbohydrate esterase [Chaetomidium leptoderma]|uniref:Carbohydrate esterase n=1 Tax=Chaetomidium leptoderma TaxID=669021 RepID=A0AAN6ZY88_9PEZI|nr:carbohydrate esterase [Chaetomidium leptoderma]
MDRPAKHQFTIRVMVVGDSIAHGREGDWTWPYRIWEWLNEQHAVRFVGPYRGTFAPEIYCPPRPPRLADEPPDLPPPRRSWGGYAAGVKQAFQDDSAHFAANGRQAHEAKDLIAEHVAAYQPDICLVQLGFNDLAWRGCGPVETLASMKHLIDQARSVKRDLDFAIANVPHRTDLPGQEDLPINTDIYNAMLAAAVPHWNSTESPIGLVRLCENYSCGGANSDAAYDGLHPNALGECQIAQAFSRTLISTFSIGRAPLVVIPEDIPPRPLPTPTRLKTIPTPSGITITWDAIYGAIGYDLERRFPGERDWGLTHVDCSQYDWRHLQRHQAVECRVRASGGDNLKSPWSNVASAVAYPSTAPPPTNVLTHATPTGFTISWDPPRRPFVGKIDRYAITHWDSDQPGAFPYIFGVRGNRAEVTGLTPGHCYYITMETWTNLGGGIPGSAPRVTVGRGALLMPEELSSTNLTENDSIHVNVQHG